jgi:hypothetical protein
VPTLLEDDLENMLFEDELEDLAREAELARERAAAEQQQRDSDTAETAAPGSGPLTPAPELDLTREATPFAAALEAAAAGPFATPEYAEAVAKLRNWLRRRKARRAFLSIIQAAKERFLDERALRAGASGTKWYTMTAMTIREALASDVTVKQRLHEAWTHILEACGVPPEMTFISKEQYVTLYRKVYLAVKLRVRCRSARDICFSHPRAHPSAALSASVRPWRVPPPSAHVRGRRALLMCSVGRRRPTQTSTRRIAWRPSTRTGRPTQRARAS